MENNVYVGYIYIYDNLLQFYKIGGKIMTSNDKYDIIMQTIEKEWYNLNTYPIASAHWEVPIYSKKEIERAGQMLSMENLTPDEEQHSLTILNNWRSSHAYPLQVIANNLRNNNPNATVVQRLKRLESITQKLKRFPNMSLYRMQDLGGCRIIVDTKNDVYKAVDKYKSSKIRHILKREYDYIQKPKESGYRSYHAVYQFHSDKKETYNKNMLIEIQFRTVLQHIWATAVEMMGLYTKTNLKSGVGNTDILRFFTLVSSVFAIKEETPICPNTSDNYNDLVNELRLLDAKYNILSMINALSVAIYYTNNKHVEQKNGYYILILDRKENTLHIQPYSKRQIELATDVYNKIERIHNTNNVDVVLVAANSFDTLKTAYPNYFVDMSVFIKIMTDIFNGN